MPRWLSSDYFACHELSYLLLIVAIIGALFHFFKLIYQLFDIIDGGYSFQDSIGSLVGLALAGLRDWYNCEYDANANLVFAKQFTLGSGYQQVLRLWGHYNTHE